MQGTRQKLGSKNPKLSNKVQRHQEETWFEEPSTFQQSLEAKRLPPTQQPASPKPDPQEWQPSADGHRNRLAHHLYGTGQSRAPHERGLIPHRHQKRRSTPDRAEPMKGKATYRTKRGHHRKHQQRKEAAQSAPTMTATAPSRISPTSILTLVQGHKGSGTHSWKKCVS